MRTFVSVVGGDDPDVRIKIAIGVGCAAVTGKGQRFAVRRPGRFVVIKVAGSNLGDPLGGDVKKVEVVRAPFKMATVFFLNWSRSITKGGGVFGFGAGLSL